MTARGTYVRTTKTAPRVFMDIKEPDWPAIIKKLNAMGYAKLQIALAANCTREWVYAMSRGRTPPWDVGAAVLKLVEVAEK